MIYFQVGSSNILPYMRPYFLLMKHNFARSKRCAEKCIGLEAAATVELRHRPEWPF